MIVNGQLGGAQFENLAADPSNLPLGRFWANIATPTAAVPKFWDGTTVQTLAFKGATAVAGGTTPTGQTVTINWDSGVTQRRRITSAYAIVKFGGTPVDGTLYTLIVDTIALQGKIYFDVDHESLGKPKVFASYNIGQTRVYTFLYQASPNASGTTGTYATMGNGFSNGATTGRALDVRYLAGQKQYFATTTGSSNQCNIGWFSTMAGAATPGTGALTTVVSAADAVSVKIHPNGRFAAFAGYNTPYISVYELTQDGTSWSAFGNPGTLPASSGLCVDWHPSGRDIAISHQVSPYISTYPINAQTFGTKYSNPVTLPTVTLNISSIKFAPSGDFIAALSDLSPYLQVWEWVQGIGFGNRITDPVGGGAPFAGAFFGRKLDWRPQMDWVVYGMNASPWIAQFPFTRSISGTFGSIVTPSLTGSPPTTSVQAVAFSPCGRWLAVGCSSVAEPLKIYPFDSSSGVDFSNPITIGSGITTDVRDIVWDPDGSAVYYVTGADAVRIFTMPHKARNWIRVNDY